MHFKIEFLPFSFFKWDLTQLIFCRSVSSVLATHACILTQELSTKRTRRKSSVCLLHLAGRDEPSAQTQANASALESYPHWPPLALQARQSPADALHCSM
jgi:hypothetical protein